MKEKNKELLRELGQDSLVVAKVVGKGALLFAKATGKIVGRAMETGYDNLMEEMRTKDHQRTVWDGIMPTKYTVEDTKKNRSHYTVAEMRRRK